MTEIFTDMSLKNNDSHQLPMTVGGCQERH